MTLLLDIETKAQNLIQNAQDLASLEEIRLEFFGKKGVITESMKGLGTLDPEIRKTQGAALNTLKNNIEILLQQKHTIFEEKNLEDRLANEWQDITLPIRPEAQGKVHPLTQVTDEIVTFFAKQGFTLETGPDIETMDNNFNALNTPDHHPARQMQDTFYLNAKNPQVSGESLLLRTQTSTVQIRAMRNGQPPFRLMSTGRVYRADYDQTHTPMFHQLEILAVDKNLHMGHLKSLLTSFLTSFFGIETKDNIRFRPSFFPFTEPSAEVDIRCDRSGGKLQLGTGNDWLEVLGCGMVHPNVLENCGVDHTEWGGFAAGIGLERLTMLKYGLPDLRSFFESDVRWLEHYGFSPFSTPSLFGESVR